MALLLIDRALYKAVSYRPLTPWNGTPWTVWLLPVHHYLYGTVPSAPLSSPNCFYSAFNSMKVASPSLNMWNIFSRIDELIFAQMAEKFPVFCAICSLTAAAVQVYCNFQQSSCTLQPFISHRRFDDWSVPSSVAVAAVRLPSDHFRSIAAAVGLIGPEELRRSPQLWRHVSRNTAPLCVLSVSWGYRVHTSVRNIVRFRDFTPSLKTVSYVGG
jgi:hypothetical protein